MVELRFRSKLVSQLLVATFFAASVVVVIDVVNVVVTVVVDVPPAVKDIDPQEMGHHAPSLYLFIGDILLTTLDPKLK